MKVILLQDIKSLGKRGDVKNVSDGYARNFLLPRKMVRSATEGAIQELEKERARIERQAEELKSEVRNIEKFTAAEPLTFQIKAGEKGEIFGSVGAKDIQEKLLERFPELQSADLEIKADHIRELGKQEIGIELRATPKGGFAASGKVEGKVTIEIIPSTH